MAFVQQTALFPCIGVTGLAKMPINLKLDPALFQAFLSSTIHHLPLIYPECAICDIKQIAHCCHVDKYQVAISGDLASISEQIFDTAYRDFLEREELKITRLCPHIEARTLKQAFYRYIATFELEDVCILFYCFIYHF